MVDCVLVPTLRGEELRREKEREVRVDGGRTHEHSDLILATIVIRYLSYNERITKEKRKRRRKGKRKRKEKEEKKKKGKRKGIPWPIFLMGRLSFPLRMLRIHFVHIF